MANSSLVYRSSITTSNIKKSLSGLETGIKNSQKSSNSVSQSLSKRNEQKRQAVSVKSTLFLKRREAVRRRDQEDIVEAGSVFGGVRRAQRVVMNSTKGFMGRILDYIGTLLVGWAVINLPTIISMAKQLGTRIQKLTGILATFMSDTKDFMLGFGQLLGGVFQNVVSFDFTDSQGRLTSALNEMKQSFQRMEDSIYDGIVLLTKPIDFGIPDDLGQEEEQPRESREPGQTNPPGQPPSGPGGGGRWKPLLDVIASGEGGYTSIYPSDQNPNLTQMTIADANRAVGVKGGRGAIGRYQFTTPINQAKAAGLNPDKDLFSPENQDKMAVAIIEGKRGGRDWLAGKLTDEQFGYQLAKEFAGLKQPNGVGFYDYDGRNKATVNWKDTKSALQKVKTQPASTSQFQPGTLGTKPLKPGDKLTQSIGRGVDFIQIGDVMGAPRGGGRKHAGIDIQCPSGTYIALRADSEVMFAGWQDPNNHNKGYGLVIDLWVPELGVQLRFGHCSGFLVNSGKVKAGRSFARVGSTGNSSGPHIHFEYTKSRGAAGYGSDSDPSPYVPYILLTNKPNNVPFSKPANTTAVAPGSISIDNVQTEQRRLRGETKDNVITVPLPSSQQRSAGMMPVGGAPSVTMMSDDELNRFITQKLLLDLAYT